ncbi:xanthine dehydrogenase family protein molybdopterin-binding subunit [Thalassospira sp.]|uniref:xanthine dehydrogenase family protein molybdopterin-binding subunit n=1 Tax=Thalassospira sp. TaxID=1912094 RepID=UPI002736C20A|nr:xanthine dehydrogenase family protein molybdopterin-binding subunit [Thalassospira sp.]MDP2698602.1 xanthine dehydrogenase family protein molybdopterin-binding subunit [Thalassospira sp.]
MTITVSRRGFLKATAAGTTALLVGLNTKGVLAAGSSAAATTDLNPFVKIDADGTVTVIIKHFEMGQGTTTGLTTLVAEELDADWDRVQIDFAPSDNNRYANLFFGAQGTGGSTSIANSFMQYREAGAAARDILVRAAARQWDVDASTITVENGILTSGGNSGHFGEFVAIATTLEAVEKPMVKTPDQFKLIGSNKLHRKDNSGKTNGTAMFAMDVNLPGMIYAVIMRSPKFGGTVVSFDDSAAKEVGGFIAAQTLPNKAGVVAFGKNTWAAFQARDALSVEWDFSQAETRSTDTMIADHKVLLDAPEFDANHEVPLASVAPLIAEAAKTIDAEFTFPFLAHAPLEPENCVIEPTENGVRVHDGCQFPTLTQPMVAAALDLDPSQVEVKTLYAGGSFGRRANASSDYNVEAAMAYAVSGRKVPVKLVWSREDDIKGGYYRPMSAHRAKIGLDANGKIMGWDHRAAVKSIAKGGPFEGMVQKNGVDPTSVEGVSESLYSIPNFGIGLSDFKTAVPINWWRSVGHSHTGFVMESLMDMVAKETGQDPIEMRLAMLDPSGANQARMIEAIKLVREISGWKEGDQRGFASHYSFNTCVAVVADITVEETTVHVNKLFMAVECGVAVNPDVIRAQMEGGAGFALSAIFRNEITLTDGEVDQYNFPDYELLRNQEMPEIEVAIVQSNNAPTGVGEPGVPPTAPAVANAIFAKTGTRIMDLPMTRAGFDFV